MTPKRKKVEEPEARSEVLVIRMTVQERAELDAAARAERLPTGTWLRRLGLQEAARQRGES